MLLLGKQEAVTLAISVTEISGNAPAHYVRNPTVGREKDFSFILKLLPNSYNLCMFFFFFRVTIVQSATHFGIKTLLKSSILT